MVLRNTLTATDRTAVAAGTVDGSNLPLDTLRAQGPALQVCQQPFLRVRMRYSKIGSSSARADAPTAGSIAFSPAECNVCSDWRRAVLCSRHGARAVSLPLAGRGG